MSAPQLFGVAALLVLVAVTLVIAAPALTKSFVPQPLDQELLAEAAVTKTANYNGASKDLGAGFAPGGVGMPIAAIINATAVDRVTGDETYSFVLQESADNSSFTACGPAVTIDVSGNSATLGCYAVPGFVTQRYVRAALTVAGTTPSITYETHVSPNIV